MAKFLSRLSIVTLIFVLALSFVGCGSSSGGGGNDGPTSIEGYWKVKSIAEGSEKDIYPRIVDLSEKGFNGKVEIELYWGLNNKRFYEYQKIKFDGVDEAAEAMLKDMGIEEGVYFEVVADRYSISSGNTVTYTDSSDSYPDSQEVTMKFQITAKNATIIREYPDGTKETILAGKVDSSAVKGAKEKPGSEDSGDASDMGYWKVTRIEIEGENPEDYPFTVGGIKKELFYGFADGIFFQYERYTGTNEDGRKALQDLGIEDGQLYHRLIGYYTCDGNTVRYTDISGNYEGNQPEVSMVFNDSGVINQEGPGLDVGIIYIEEIDASAVAGAKPMPN